MESNKLLPRDRLLLGYETSTWMKLHFTEYIQKRDQNSPCCLSTKFGFFFLLFSKSRLKNIDRE